MIEIYLGIFIAFIVSLTVGIKWAYKKGSQDLFKLFVKSAFNDKVSTFQALNPLAQPHQNVIIGDSITEQCPTDELLPTKVVYNRGIGGDTTPGVLTRLKESCFDLHPDRVFIWIGTNDFALLNTSVKIIHQNIEAIVTHIHRQLPAAKVFVMSVCPVNPRIDRVTVGPRNNHSIQALNQLLKTQTTATYIDVHSALVDSDGSLNASFTRDGLHLTPEAYQEIIKIIEPNMV